MQVELVGCTGAGKSTFLRAMLQACREEGIAASPGEDYLLGRLSLSWIRAPLARSLLLDLVTLPFTLLAWRSDPRFLRFASRVISGLPHTVPWWERLNIGRNVLKKVGLYEGLRRTLPPDHLAIIDEGTVHTAHYLLVHASAEPPEGVLVEFASLAPLPDALILLRGEEQVLVSRTLERGHRRIPTASQEPVKLFIRRAVEMFDALSRMPALRDRMFVTGGDGSLSAPGPTLTIPGGFRLPAILREAIRIAHDAHLHNIASSLPNENAVVSHDSGTD